MAAKPEHNPAVRRHPATTRPMKTFPKPSLALVAVGAIGAGFIAPLQASAGECGPPAASLLTSGHQALFGNAVGPDGALYVAETDSGSILRVDPQTGNVTTFASGLPTAAGGGGPFDIAFK